MATPKQFVLKNGLIVAGLTGYLKGGDTSAVTASATIPGSDISGNITGSAANVTGVVAIANGGTNSTATPTNGGVGYGTGTAHAYSAAGTSGQFLKSNGAAAPSFVTLALTDIPDAWTKKSTRVATTAALTASYSANVLTNTGTLAALSIDGITLAVNDRVLVKNQATAAHNGIYYVSAVGSASVAWTMTRAASANTSAEIASAVTVVDVGTVNGGSAWTTTFKSTDTLGTTAMNWYELVDSGNYTDFTVTKTGTGASGTWGIAITGNAATATKLATARTINGVSFDGSANITVEDSTKLPLTGGTLTGSLYSRGAYGMRSSTIAGNPILFDVQDQSGNVVIEIGRTDGVAGSSNLDFHSGATAVDYDVRLQVTGGNGSNGGGTMNFTAGAIQWNGNDLVTVNAPSFAGNVKRSVATIGAAGSTQGTATAITTDVSVVSTSTAGTAIGVILPANATGTEIIVINASANDVNVYPSSGSSIDALAANTAFSLPAGSRIMFIATSATKFYTLNATFA